VTHWHGYMGIENLNLNGNQKRLLIDEIKALGPSNEDRPWMLNHWKTRLDGNAAIFEANFRKDKLTIEKFEQRLGNIFGVDPNTINHTTSTPSFGGGITKAVTFSRGGTNYIVFALFGGINSSWGESHRECKGFLKQYESQWKEIEQEGLISRAMGAVRSLIGI
jgi:hypothetical protein